MATDSFYCELTFDGVLYGVDVEFAYTHGTQGTFNRWTAQSSDDYYGTDPEVGEITATLSDEDGNERSATAEEIEVIREYIENTYLPSQWDRKDTDD